MKSIDVRSRLLAALQAHLIRPFAVGAPSQLRSACAQLKAHHPPDHLVADLDARGQPITPKAVDGTGGDSHARSPSRRRSCQTEALG